MGKRSLRWGLIGGGKGSQIGGAHRIAALMDRNFTLEAAALDIDPVQGKRFARKLGIDKDRAYSDWQTFIKSETDRSDPVHVITIATPNASHYPIAKSCLEAGFHVLCEKPLTLNIKEAQNLVELAARRERILVVNFGYTGYPMVRQARAMVAAGELGEVRLIVAQFAHGQHADAADSENPRVRWRYDPAQAGISSILADCGIHAQQLANYISGQRVDAVSAHYVSVVDGRLLEDDAAVQMTMSGGATCRLWTSAVALGRTHGLQVEVFGDKGGIRWEQEQPNQLRYTKLDHPVQILERGAEGLHADARAATRIAVGHPEGMLGAFANIYSDMHGAISGNSKARARLPLGEAGLDMVRFVEQATKSAKNQGRWIDVVSGG